MALVGTGNGFTADLMTAGTMLADRIRGGQFRVGGFGNGDGIFELYDQHDTMILRFNNSGIELFNGAQLIGNGGVLSTFTFSSSGTDGNLQLFNVNYVGYLETMCILSFILPEDFNVTEAHLTITSVPTEIHENGSLWGTTHVRNQKIFKSNSMQGYKYIADFPGHSYLHYDDSAATDVSSQIFGSSSWTPSGSNVVEITREVSNLIDVGRNIFYIKSAYTGSSFSIGLVGMALTVTGYQR